MMIALHCLLESILCLQQGADIVVGHGIIWRKAQHLAMGSERQIKLACFLICQSQVIVDGAIVAVINQGLLPQVNCLGVAVCLGQ